MKTPSIVLQVYDCILELEKERKESGLLNGMVIPEEIDFWYEDKNLVIQHIGNKYYFKLED